MQFGPRAIAPVGQAWSNLRLAQELARRLGVRDAVFSMTTDEMLRALWSGARGPAAAIDPESVRAAGPIRVHVNGRGQRFATPSAKLEFYSSHLAAQGLPPMPDWAPDAAETADAARWPLRLLTAPGYYQSHTAFSANARLMQIDRGRS